MDNNPTFERLENQIDWYDSKSRFNQSRYTGLKFTSIGLAAFIPLASIYLISSIPAVMAALIVIIEAVQSINQHHDLWFTYRSTAESLKHEKYLYLAKAGPYEGVEYPERILAERLEKTVSQEHARWVDSAKKCEEPKARYNAP